MPRSPEGVDYLHLSPAERLLLVQDILDSVVAEAPSAPLTAAQMEEMQRRADDIDSGRVRLLPWDEVRSRFLAGG
ncbi:MAG TPA: addiction module protein [Phycisphaerales bacterium]|nr:addiction module protein [Phycisphaerales bacterium]